MSRFPGLKKIVTFGLATVFLTLIACTELILAVSNVSASPVGSGNRVTWNDDSYGEDGFNVYRDPGLVSGIVAQQDDDFNGTLIATVGPNKEEYTDTQVEEGQAYRYAVEAFADGMTSEIDADDISEVVVIGPDLTPPEPGALSLSAEVGGTAAGAFRFGNAGGEDLAYEVAVTVGDFFLSVNPAAGSVLPGGSADVTVTAACLDDVTFDGEVTVSTNDPTGGTATVDVTLTCTPSPSTPPRLTPPEPGALSLSAEVGGTAAGAFRFGNAGGEDLAYEVAVTVGDFFLSVNPAAGSVPPGGSADVTVTAACLDDVTFGGEVEVLGTNDPDPATNTRTVTVTLTCAFLPVAPAPPL